MLGIYKRPKTTGNFAQIENNALQNLTDLGAIGLLGHLMSRPTEWVIRKTYLYHLFGRGPVAKAIAVLEEQKLWIDIEVRCGGRRSHIYSVSDQPFSDDDVITMLKEIKKSGQQIKQISEPFRYLLAEINEEPASMPAATDYLPEDEQPNQQKQINKNEEHPIPKGSKQMEPKKFKKALAAACNKLYPTYAPGRWSKQAWNTMIKAFINETIESARYKKVPDRNIPAYAEASIRKMVHTNDLKSGRKVGYRVTSDPKIPELLGTGAWLNW